MRRLLLAFGLLLPFASLALADGPVVKQSTCTLLWDAPQTNANGTNLADLKEYRVYVSDSAIALGALTVPTAVVPAPEADPPAGRTGIWTGCRALNVGQHYAAVSAADLVGNESARSNTAPFVLQDDVSPQAPSNPRFGP